MNLFRIRIKWIVVTALLSIFVGVVGIALSITPEFVRFITSLDLRNLVPDKSDATYMLYDEIDVQPSANVQILATGGNVSISESPTNQIKVFFHVPYKPNDRLIPLIAQNGATYVIDERAIWQELAGNTSQPNITLDVQVPLWFAWRRARICWRRYTTQPWCCDNRPGHGLQRWRYTRPRNPLSSPGVGA